MNAGAIVLCGGTSRRMGRSKALLPFGPESMLQRVVRIVSQVAEPVIVVAAAGQELPELPRTARVARDRQPDRGPLEGMAAGLRALAHSANAAYVTACDVPLLVPAFVRCVLEHLTGYDAAVPHLDGFDQPLAAAYRLTVLPHIKTLLDSHHLRPRLLFDRVRTRRIPAKELRMVDPELDSLANVNTPADYRAALAKAGLGSPSGS